MTLEIESVVDRGVRGDEALGLALGLEPLHFSLSSPDREMAVFDAVVVAQSAGLMSALALQYLQCGAVRGEAVGDDLLGNEALVL